MKLLVPIDFSQCSLNALHLAIQLARATGSELMLIHVFHVPIGGDAAFFVDKVMVEREQHHVQSRLMKVIETTPEIHRVPYQHVIKMAMVTDGIIEAARENHIDLIMMGTNGSNNFSTDLLGSNTYSVIKRSSCPVLAVPENVKDLHLTNIAFASDLKTIKDISALEFLITLAQKFKAEVHILHVHPRPVTLGLKPAEEALELDHIFHQVPHTYHFLEESDVEKGIQHYLQTHSADLLVMMPRRHNLFERLWQGSLTRHMALHSKIPLLTFHP